MVRAHWMAVREGYNVCMSTQYALGGLVARGAVVLRHPPSQTVEVCQFIGETCLGSMTLGWYVDRPGLKSENNSRKNDPSHYLTNPIGVAAP